MTDKLPMLAFYAAVGLLLALWPLVLRPERGPGAGQLPATSPAGAQMPLTSTWFSGLVFAASNGFDLKKAPAGRAIPTGAQPLIK